MTSERIRDIGEAGLLKRIIPRLPTTALTQVPAGDDAAVVRTPDSRVVVSTDVLVENFHFRRTWSSGSDVGRRAAIQNLADCYAMGARPTSMVVSLVLPASLEAEWVESFTDGLSQECAAHGVGWVGGDLSGGESIVISVTMMGDLERRAPVLRSGAQPGDDILYAGALGYSAAGLALLRSGVAQSEYVDFFRVPISPLALGIDAAKTGATAMLDVSDGLLLDARRIAIASSVVMDIRTDSEALGRARDTLAPTGDLLRLDPWEWVLGGGEDHGFLATAPPGAGLAGFAVIGSVCPVPEGARPAVTLNGSDRWRIRSGWGHFGQGE